MRHFFTMAQSRACQLLDFLMRQLLPIIIMLLLAGCESTPSPVHAVIYHNITSKTNKIPSLLVTTELEFVDPASFQRLQASYTKDKNYVFYRDHSIPFADAASFEVLSDYHAKDKNRLYYRGNPIKGAVPKDIKVLSDDDFHEKYILSNGIVYLNEGLISFRPCDVKTVKVMWEQSFIKDNQCVFHLGHKLAGANPDKFIAINENYGKDKTHAYFTHLVIANADVNSFDAEGPAYATDKNYAYYQNRIMPGVAPNWLDADFDGNDHAIDKTSVYFQAEKIPGADRKSFLVLKSQYGLAKDKKQCYLKTEVVDCNIDPYEMTRPALPTDLYSGIDMATLNSEHPSSATTLKMVNNLLSLQQRYSDVLPKLLPELLKVMKNQFASQLLTPEQVSKIDLTRLPVGFHYTMTEQTDSPGLSYNYTVEFKGITNNTAEFLFHRPEIHGVMKEQRNLSSQVLLRSMAIIVESRAQRFEPAECLFQLGRCQAVGFKIGSGKHDTTVVDIHYEDGVWYHRDPQRSDNYDIYMFDKNGFTLVKLTVLNNQLETALLRN